MRRLLSSVLVFASVATACGGGDDTTSWDVEKVEFGARRIVDLESDLFRVSFSPSADRYATFERSDNIVDREYRVCVEPLTADVDTACTDFPGPAGADSATWGPAGDDFVWTNDFVRSFEEPDVWRYDAASDDFDDLTDDGVDEFDRDSDRDIDIDIAPFIGDDGTVYFFRARDLDDRFRLFRIDDDGEVDSVGRVRLPSNVFISGPPLRIDEHRWTLVAVDFENDGSILFVIDVNAESIESFDLDAEAVLVAATETHVLVADQRQLSRFEPDAFSIVSIDDGRDRLVDADLDDGEIARAVGFSPDGSFVVVLVGRDFDSDVDSRLLGLPFDENGRLDDPVEIATTGDLFDEDDVDDDGDAPEGFGLGVTGSQLVWADDGTLTIGAGRNRVAVIETTPG